MSKFADDSKLGGTTEGKEALQRDLDKIENWAIASCMKFKKSKCCILHLGRGNPGYMYSLGDEMLRAALQKEIWVSWSTAS